MEPQHQPNPQTPLRSKRRPKPSKRFLSYLHKPHNPMLHHPQSHHSSVQPAPPSSSYDADEEDECEHDPPTAPNLRKRPNRTISRPLVNKSRRVSGRRTNRTTTPTLAAQPANPSSFENPLPNQSIKTPPSARKRSRSRLHPVNQPVIVFHTQPGVPGIKLWDHHNKILVPEKVLPSQLAQVLRDNKQYAIYVGQDEKYIRYPGDVLTLTTPANQEPWMNELRKPPAERKIMIVDPKSAKLLAPRNCPTLDNLTAYLEDLRKQRSKHIRRRVFNAHYTDSYGFTQQRWNSMFSVPPPVSENTPNNSPADLLAMPETLQLPPRAPSLPLTLPNPRPSPTLRQLKDVPSIGASPDPAEFQSSASDSSKAEPEHPPSSSRLSTPCASGTEDFESHFDDEVSRRKQQRKMYDDIFPASSSEHEHTEVPDHSSPNPSSDESDVEKHIHMARASVVRNYGDAKTVSPASVLVLNRTPTFKLQKLYSFQESSSASEDSLSEALDGNSFGDVQHVDNADINETTQPSQEDLRLKFKNHPEGDTQTLANMCQSEQRKESNSLSLRMHVGESSIKSSDQRMSEALTQKEVTTAKNQPEGEALCKDATVQNVVARPRRRVREISSLARENVQKQPEFEVSDCIGSYMRPKEGSNDASTCGSKRNSIRNQERIGCQSVPTNEKFCSKHEVKNGERVEDEVPSRLPDSGTPVSGPAHVVTSRSEEATHCRPSRLAASPGASVTNGEKNANPHSPQSDKEYVRGDSNTSFAEQFKVPATTGEKESESFPTPTEVQSSEEVYLWDYATKTKSDTLIPLSTALELCGRNNLLMVYDGQDLKRGDQNFAEIWSDTQAWMSRRGTTSSLKRRLRVWDHCTGRIEKFCFSPPMCEVEQWLKSNPDNSLFRPSLSMQYERRLPVRGGRKTGLSVQSRVRRVIQTQVINRLRHLRVSELSEGPQRQVLLWNTLKRKCEPPRDFPSRSHLICFLFSNPALELLRGQDEVSRLERSSDHKLIHITWDCPADCISFWDAKLGRMCVRPKERETSKRSTIQECINAERDLEVYVGQDRPDTERMREIIANSKVWLALCKPSRSNSSYTLAHCGPLLQTHVYSKGWVPKYIETQKESASHAAFWSRSRKALVMEAVNSPLLSIEEYMKASPDLELYVGQDMPVQVQERLHSWFELLRYETGIDANKAAPMLLRYSLVPLRYRAVRLTSGDEFRVSRNPLKRQRRGRQETSEAELEGDISKRNKRTSMKRQRLSLKVNKRSEDERNHNASVSSFSDQEGSLLENGGAPETEMTGARSQDTNYEEENLNRGSGPVCTSTPSSSTLDDHCSESGSEVDTAIGTEGDVSVSLPDHLPDAEDHIRSAAKSAKKMICVIREAGPKVLKRELIHDVRQNLREQLILEVESVKHLSDLVKEFSLYDFAALANELCEALQLLDVHGCFSCSADLVYTPNDLSSIREDLEAGRICTSLAVIKRFREVCAGLIQFHEGTLLHGQAALLRFYGEELIARFQKSHALHLEKEQHMLRVFRICERAKHIGFRSGPRNRKTKHLSNLLSLGSSEPSLRVTGRQPEVTFLNYRDEKGNSVMGKRPSVRVFGFTIDTKALEEKIGSIRPCHICRKEVALSQADAMRCSNHIFGICEEVVCKECLETVFSLERNEFKILRDSENWFCVHCRGLCPSGSECTRAVVSTGTCSSATTTGLRFVWPYAPSGAESVVAVISKRHRNGEYDAFPETLPEDKFDLEQDPSEKNWFTVMHLGTGAYRCQVMVDNFWAASTTFHVLSSRTDSVPAYHSEKLSTVPQASIVYTRTSHPRSFGPEKSAKLVARAKPRGPRIRWHPVPKDPSHPVHAIRDESAQDGGTLVKECSRTEGYDWRRAKRHATLQWLPELRSADESQMMQRETPKRAILCAIDSERAHLAAMDNPPKPRTGASHKDFMVTLNTFRYNEMLKSLWSIVTGKSHIHGIGLFTLSGYKKGDFVIEYAGDLIRTPLADIREARYDAAGLGTYLFKINDGQIVDATVQSNRARFTNHSCDPNMVADIVHVQGRDLIVLRATREIPKFTELTFDYKFPYEEAKVQCLCNSWNCVGVMN